MTQKFIKASLPVNRKFFAIGLSLVLLSMALALEASAQSKIASIRQVRKIYLLRMTGDRVFSSRLKKEMQQMGLRFVSAKSDADAVLTGSGQYSEGEFYGQIKFFNLDGKIIWQAKATRPCNSNYMAYSRLADQLRRALGK